MECVCVLFGGGFTRRQMFDFVVERGGAVVDADRASMWVGEGGLYFDFVDDLGWWEAEDLEAAQRALGQAPRVAVALSHRHSNDSYLMAYLLGDDLARRHGGVLEADETPPLPNLLFLRGPLVRFTADPHRELVDHWARPTGPWAEPAPEIHLGAMAREVLVELFPHGTTDELLRDAVLRLLSPLLRGGELVAGDLADGGVFTPWEGSPGDHLRRIEEGWRPFEELTSLGGDEDVGCWFRRPGVGGGERTATSLVDRRIHEAIRLFRKD